jgi:hypothetical protein
LGKKYKKGKRKGKCRRKRKKGKRKEKLKG